MLDQTYEQPLAPKTGKRQRHTGGSKKTHLHQPDR
jgi:hypothetical protein